MPRKFLKDLRKVVVIIFSVIVVICFIAVKVIVIISTQGKWGCYYVQGSLRTKFVESNK